MGFEEGSSGSMARGKSGSPGMSSKSKGFWVEHGSIFLIVNQVVSWNRGYPTIWRSN